MSCEAKKQIFHVDCYIVFYMIKRRGCLLSIVIVGRVLLREPRADSEKTTVSAPSPIFTHNRKASRDVVLLFFNLKNNNYYGAMDGEESNNKEVSDFT